MLTVSGVTFNQLDSQKQVAGIFAEINLTAKILHFAANLAIFSHLFLVF